MKTLIAAAIVAAALAGGCSSPAGPIGPVSDSAEFAAVWAAAGDVLFDYGFRVDRADRRAGIVTTYPIVGKSWFEFWRHDAVTARDTLESSVQTLYKRAVVRVCPVAAPPAGQEPPSVEPVFPPPLPAPAPASGPAATTQGADEAAEGPEPAPPATTTEPAPETPPEEAPAPGPPAPPVAQHYRVEVTVYVARSNRANPQVTSTSEAYEMFLSLERVGGEARRSATDEEAVPLGRDENLQRVLQAEVYGRARRQLRKAAAGL